MTFYIMHWFVSLDHSWKVLKNSNIKKKKMFFGLPLTTLVSRLPSSVALQVTCQLCVSNGVLEYERQARLLSGYLFFHLPQILNIINAGLLSSSSVRDGTQIKIYSLQFVINYMLHKMHMKIIYLLTKKRSN